MASRLFRLWGQPAPVTATSAGTLATGLDADAASQAEKGKEGEAKGEEADGQADKGKEAEGAAENKADKGDGEEDENDEDDEDDEDDEEEKEAAAAAAKVPAAVARRIRRAERQRMHAIVDAAGPDRVAQAMHLALNTNMSAKSAVGFLEASPPGATSGGRLGLAGAMDGRPQRPIAPAAGTSGASEVDQAASGILAFSSKRTVPAKS